MAGRNPFGQPFVKRSLISVPPRKRLVAGTACDPGEVEIFGRPSPLRTRAGITRSTTGGPVMRLAANQLGVLPLAMQDLKLPERGLAGDGSGFEQ
jgi:hypothetical protein